MKFYKYLLLFLAISIVYRIYYLFFRNKTKKEGFESLSNCLSLGYPDDFCKRAPLEACITNCPLGNFVPKKFNVFS
jgi:hypothetical protein